MGLEASLIALGVGAETAASVASAASIVGTVGSIVSAGSSLIGGFQSNSEAQNQADQAMASAAMKGRESARVAARQATFEKSNLEDTLRRQKVAYLASGVDLEGSPLMVMEDTHRKGMDNVNEIIASGGSSAAAAQTEGSIQADALRSKGRQAFMSGITGGVNALTRLAK